MCKAITFEHELLSGRVKHFGLALKLTKNKLDAEDLYHTCLLKAITKKHLYNKKSGSVSSWFYVLMRNTFLSEIRKKKKMIFCSEEVDHASNVLTDSLVIIEEVNGRVEQLPDNLKKCLKIRMEGYSYADISEELGLKMGTVKNTIFRARKELADLNC